MHKHHPWDDDLSMFTDDENSIYNILKRQGYTREHAWKYAKTYAKILEKNGKDSPPEESIKAFAELMDAEKKSRKFKEEMLIRQDCYRIEYDALLSYLKNNFTDKYDPRRRKEYGDPFESCVEDFCESLVNPAWKEIKDRGNDYLNEKKDVKMAIHCYTSAYHIAIDRGYGLKMLIVKLPKDKRNSPMVKVLGDSYLRLYISEFIQKPPGASVSDHVHFEYHRPNRPAAICLYNRSIAHGRLNDMHACLKDLKLAAKRCPYYLKVYRRMRLAYEKLENAPCVEVMDNILESWKDLNKAKFPIYTGILQMLLSDYASQRTVDFYDELRTDMICDWFSRNADSTIGVAFSIVPLGDGQHLTGNLVTTVNFEHVEVHSSIFCMLDASNCELTESRRHGLASEQSRADAPKTIASILFNLKSEWKFKMTDVCLGQALVDEDIIDETQRRCDNFKLGVTVRRVLKTQHGYIDPYPWV